MNVNDYIDIANKTPYTGQEKTPEVDHSTQVNVGLEMAKRHADKPAESPKIPTLGATPLAN